MKFKKIAVISAVAFSIVLASCQSDIETSNSETTSIVYETKPVPEDGWTAEELASVFYLNGKPIPYPFTIESLGDEYSIDKDKTTITEEGNCTAYLCYKGKKTNFYARYIDIQNYEDLFSKEANFIVVGIEKDNLIEYEDSIVIFNGIKLGSTKEKIESVFGEATDIINNLVTYKHKNIGKTYMIFDFDDNEELRAFSLDFQVFL